MWHPLGVEDEYLYFYTKVIEDFGVDILFTLVEPLILKIMNIVPLQGACNIKSFVRGFKILCQALNITPMEGILFFFHENNGVNMVEWVSASIIPGWDILLPYTSNYKNSKDKFFRVKVSAYYPEIM